MAVDTFLKNRIFPKLIRMDVEGYEYEIIKGMPQTLNKNIRILVELHPHLLDKKIDEILMILVQNNFKVRFAAFEDKVEENKIVRLLFKKAGNKLPLVASNISCAELKNLINENPDACPNVVFQK
jgi:hypothetical protein